MYMYIYHTIQLTPILECLNNPSCGMNIYIFIYIVLDPMNLTYKRVVPGVST